MNSNVSLILLVSLFLSSALFAGASATVAAGRKAELGDWTPIKDLNDPQVKRIALFAVREYNARSTVPVKVMLVKILSGETQTDRITGAGYRLLFLDTVAGTASRKYSAVVYEETDSQHSLELISFIPANY